MAHDHVDVPARREMAVWIGISKSHAFAAEQHPTARLDVLEIGLPYAKELVTTFGAHRAVDVIWHIAWCNYMTRVADAFQLPLERDNVFARPEEKKADGAKPE